MATTFELMGISPMGFNDVPAGLRSLATALASIDPAMPWHLNGFVPRSRWADRPPTSLDILQLTAGMAYARGLHHVYVGKVASGALHHTRCHACHATLISPPGWLMAGVPTAGRGFRDSGSDDSEAIRDSWHGGAAAPRSRRVARMAS